ncbi:MAG: hypothetical protein AB8G86_03955 [Saprospiraceae bacterium]
MLTTQLNFDEYGNLTPYKVIEVDLVTFLDYSVYEKRGNKVLDKFWTFSLEDEGIDSYLVRDYPENHPKFAETFGYREKWSKLYTRTRDEAIIKGFLKIKFEK